MIDITSFLLKHLYELMADNYNATTQRDNELALRRQQRPCSPDSLSQLDESSDELPNDEYEPEQDDEEANGADQLSSDIERVPSACCGREGRCRAQSAPRCSDQSSNEHSPRMRMPNTNQRTAAAATSRQQPAPATGPLTFLKRSFSGACQTESSSSRSSRRLEAREQETNQQIVSFLINNQLPDLACETLIELIFISVFLAISWIFVMIIQLHCQQQQQQHSMAIGSSSSSDLLDQPVEGAQRQHSYESARQFYCNTKFLSSLMYCNNRDSRLFSS